MCELSRAERILLGAFLDMARLCLARALKLLRCADARGLRARYDVLRADKVLQRISARYVPDDLWKGDVK